MTGPSPPTVPNDKEMGLGVSGFLLPSISKRRGSHDRIVLMISSSNPATIILASVLKAGSLAHPLFLLATLCGLCSVALI